MAKTSTIDTPIIYAITSGNAREGNITAHRAAIVGFVRNAVDAGITAIQIREKEICARSLFTIAKDAVAIKGELPTALLINDRSDVTLASGADGVHLRTDSIGARYIREKFGMNFRICVSTHSIAEALAAKENGADFVVFGPVFESHTNHSPKGIESLAEVAELLGDFPVVALGGVNESNLDECFRAGASGIAGIRLFEDPSRLREITSQIKSRFS